MPLEGPVARGADAALRGAGPRAGEHQTRLPQFRRRMKWFLRNRRATSRSLRTGARPRREVAPAPVAGERGSPPAGAAATCWTSQEFLSPHGIRALSRFHQDHPYVLRVDGAEHRVAYEPAESTTGLFGGNSNWRGPVWFPMNFLLIEALQRFDHFYRGEFKVEFPTGSGRQMALWDVAAELSRRLTRIFLRDPDGPPAGPRRGAAVPDRPALARPAPLLRVLPRRHRGGHRGEPPDRLDRSGGEAPPAERGVAMRHHGLRQRGAFRCGCAAPR